MDPFQIWIFVKVEVSTDGGLAGHYWLAKQHTIRVLFIGLELDYRALTRETVIVDRILQDPSDGQLKGYQETWLSISVGDLALWEHNGWSKMQMSESEVAENK